MKRKSPLIFLLVLLLVITVLFPSFLPVQGKEAADSGKEPSGLYARSACLMDASTGRVLFEKDGGKELPMASTTKIMTLIVTLENSSLDDVVTVSSKAARQPDVQLNINTGEQYYLRDLLYSLMLESHNDAAWAIAEHVGGSVEGFAGMMNKKAGELSLSHTHFVTPNGLDAEGHYTTAEDLARIMAYCIMESPEKETFLEITRTPSYTFTDLSGKRSFTCNNHNAFLSMMEGALSGKTGFTGNAGYCYVGALRRDGKTLIVSLLACGWPNNKSYKWADTRKLMEYGLENYEYKDIFEHDVTLEPIPVINGQLSRTALSLEDQELSLLLNKKDKVEVRYQIPEMLEAPVEQGSKVGSVDYYVNKSLYKSIPIVAAASVKKINFSYCLKKIIGLWTL